MERHEFISKLGIGLMVACAGCSLVSCGSKSSDPTVGGATPPPAKGTGNLFTLDLDNDLKDIGQSTVAQGVIVVRIAAGNTADAFTAVQVSCTHRGTAIGYNSGQGIFICPAHGSEFSKTGAVVMGPASAALQKYNVAIDGSTLTVSA